MEVLLSFILSVQVGLTVYAVMKYREMLTQLQAKSKELVGCMADIMLAEESLRNSHSQMADIQKDIQVLKIKSTLGAK